MSHIVTYTVGGETWQGKMRGRKFWVGMTFLLQNNCA